MSKMLKFQHQDIISIYSNLHFFPAVPNWRTTRRCALTQRPNGCNSTWGMPWTSKETLLTNGIGNTGPHTMCNLSYSVVLKCLAESLSFHLTKLHLLIPDEMLHCIKYQSLNVIVYVINKKNTHWNTGLTRFLRIPACSQKPFPVSFFWLFLSAYSTLKYLS